MSVQQVEGNPLPAAGRRVDRDGAAHPNAADRPETGKEAQRSELLKGYEFDKGRYVIVDKEELDELKIESSEVIDLERFVNVDEIDPIYFDSPYYIGARASLATRRFASSTRRSRTRTWRARKAGPILA